MSDMACSGVPVVERHAIIQRKPIIQRTPLIGIRKPIFFNEKLEWDDVYNKLNNYIKFAAKQVTSNSLSVVSSAEDLYQEGLLLLWECFERYKHKPQKEFETLFKTSLWRKLREIGYKTEILGVELDTAFDLGYTESTISDLYENLKLQEVVSLISSSQVALNILKEIMYPSERTVWEINMDIARKDTLKQLGHSVHVPSQADVSPKVLQRSLGLTKQEFSENMKILQDSAYKVYSKDTTIKSYDPHTYSDILTDEEADLMLCKLQFTLHNLAA